MEEEDFLSRFDGLWFAGFDNTCRARIARFAMYNLVVALWDTEKRLTSRATWPEYGRGIRVNCSMIYVGYAAYCIVYFMTDGSSCNMMDAYPRTKIELNVLDTVTVVVDKARAKCISK